MKQRRRRRQRTCRHCKKLYLPDPRTRDRQKHCSAPECKCASKAWRQRRWVNSPAGRNYFREPDNVERVQQWRKAHPGYWRRKRPKVENALQDDCASQPLARQEDKEQLNVIALQDDCLMQPALVVGLIANLTGSTLQDDIALTIRKMHAYGQNILGTCPHVLRTKRCRRVGPGIQTQGGKRDRQTSVVSGAGASNARAVQLGRPPAGARPSHRAMRS